MNLIKIFIFLLVVHILYASVVRAQQTTPNTQTAPKKERTEQILIDPFSGSTSTASIDLNTNPNLANFVDQTLVGVIIGDKKRIAVLQSAQGQVNRFKINEKINSEYKILEIYKDKILVASLDNKEYEVYFNNVIRPVEKKRKSTNSLNLNIDPLSPKKETTAKKLAVKKVKEEIDDSYKPDMELKVIREDSDLDKSEKEKVSDVDVEKIKEKLKEWNLIF